MQKPSAQYHALIGKLDEFIRKFYLNDIIRGGIFSVLYISLLFLFVTALEYYFFLPVSWRTVLFWGFTLSSMLFAGNYVIRPLLHYYHLRKGITHETAATIVGQHFHEVKDKLLNILQLQQQAKPEQFALLEAGIQQKIQDIRPIRFSEAVDLRKNTRYLRFLIPPLLLFLLAWIAAPGMLTEGAERLVHHRTQYIPKAPFRFVIRNQKLETWQQEDFTLEVEMVGDALPGEVFLESRGQRFRLRKIKEGNFSHTFIQPNQPEHFQLTANGFSSNEYILQVIPRPTLRQFSLFCDYPAYTGKADEEMENTGDVTVPEGTKLSWKIRTDHAEAVFFQTATEKTPLQQKVASRFEFNRTAVKTTAYQLRIQGAAGKYEDSVNYTLQVIPDAYPQISVQEQRDSLQPDSYFYIGELSDDYGISQLVFHYQITRTETPQQPETEKTELVPLRLPTTACGFTYYWSCSQFGLKPGDQIRYCFEVFDNDGVHGSKSTRSSWMQLNMPTVKQLEQEVKKENQEIKKDLQESMQDARKLKDKLRDMQDKVLDKKNLDWQDKKNIEQLSQQQKELRQQLENIQKQLAQNVQKQESFKELSERVKEKQEQLQDLMENTLSDELKELMDKLERMLESLQKKDALEQMSEMEFSNEKLEKELDRMLELFKKLEFDQKMEETKQKLEQLAEKQDSLRQETEKKGSDQPGLEKEQADLEKELNKAQQDVQDLKKMNEELQTGQDFTPVEKSLESAEQQMQQAQQGLQKNKKDQAAKNQKSAAQQMKNAADQMQQMQMQMEMEQAEEDMQALRQLLENIVKLSFDQEKLMAAIRKTNIQSPVYVTQMQEQQRIRMNSRMVEDSLFALAKRVFQIESFITTEMANINKHMSRSVEALEDRNTYRAAGEQQYVMTGYNNLALMLNESLQQMQMQQSESQSQCNKPGQPKANCRKPGGGKPNLSQMQKQLNDKISQLGEMMKREGQPGSPKPGSKEMAKQFAEMAKQQAEIRRGMEQLNNSENKDGKKGLGELGKAIEQMNKTETQLVNKQLTQDMLMRQQEILTRLLEAENAQKQRGEKEERESNTGQDSDRRMPPSLVEYLRNRKNEAEFYRTIPPGLKPFYRSLTEKYLQNLSNP